MPFTKHYTLFLQSYCYSSFPQVLFRFYDRVFTVVKYGCCKNRVSLAVYKPFVQVLQVSYSPGCDDRNVDRLRDSFRQGYVVADLRTIPVHTRQKNFACAQLLHFLCPADCFNAGRLPTAIRVDLEARCVPFGIDGNADTLAPEDVARLTDYLGALNGRGVDRNLVSSGEKNIANILNAPYPSARSEWHEYFSRNSLDYIEYGSSFFMGCCNVEEAELVSELFLVGLCIDHGVARVFQVDEIHALDDPAFHHVQAGDDSLSQQALLPPQSVFVPRSMLCQRWQPRGSCP